MRVAIVHYHLNPGGVTSVIAATSRNLSSPHVILCGGEIKPPGLPVHLIPELGYDRDVSSARLMKLLRSEASAALGGPPNVWHFHNPTLGKNKAFPELITEFAKQGEHLLLHLHDLSEDGRPGNYLTIPPAYPSAAHVHYAFINAQDREHFLRAGLPEKQTLLLPNPVTQHSASLASGKNPLLFAPIRAIRRKNIGELLLIASLLPEGARVAVSRAPENSQWQNIYQRWKDFARARDFPVDFEVSQQDSPFSEWLEKSTHIVTTSISEGCGLFYQEAAALGKKLIGRDLPHLTKDLKIDRRSLYRRILVPAEMLDVSSLEQIHAQELAAHFRAYGREPHDLPELSEAGFYDFGNLPESFQRHILHHSDHASITIELADGITVPLKRWLSETLTLDAFPAVHFTAKDLTAIYQKIGRAEISEVSLIDSSKILDAYLPHFHFLKTKPRWTPRAILFDLYGTLLIAPAGGVKPEPDADPILRKILRDFGHDSPASPSAALHDAVLRHHAQSQADYPEIDLRELWREILNLAADHDTAELVIETERAWHPSSLMPGASEILPTLAASGISFGILSNAQINSLPSLGKLAPLFSENLSIFSYQHRIAKPSFALFQLAVNRLQQIDISPGDTLYIGNDPLQDILPASAVGFRTALFTGHADSLRPGNCQPDFTIQHLRELLVFS